MNDSRSSFVVFFILLNYCIISLLSHLSLWDLLWFCYCQNNTVVMYITVNKCWTARPLLPGSTRTVVGHPVEPENFLSSVQVLIVSWIKGLPPKLDRWRVRLGMSRRKTSSGCAVPHCGSNSMVVQRTQSGNDTWGKVRRRKINLDLNLLLFQMYVTC